MPDVNLLQNNKEPVDRKTPKTGRPDLPLSDPAAPKGIGGMFRSLFGKKAATPTTAALPQGTGVRASQQSTDRILSEKRTSAGPLVQLPESDDDFQVNLLSEDVVSHVNPRQKLIQLGLIALGAIVVVVGADVGLGVYKGTVDKDLLATQQEVATTAATVTALQQKTQNIQTVTSRVSAIKTILANHVYWTQFFSRLEKYTLRTVTYGADFSGNLQGGITLSAKTSSFEELAKQYLLLQQAVQSKDFISSFSISGAVKKPGTVQGQDEIDFSISMVLLPEAFQQQATGKDGADASSALADAQRQLDGTCYIVSHPDILSTFPAAFQPYFANSATIQTRSSCQGMSDANLQQGKDLIQADTDKDGLNDFLELMVGTSSTKSDTNGNSKNDLQDILACQNPVSTGPIANCDPANPLASLLK